MIKMRKSSCIHKTDDENILSTNKGGTAALSLESKDGCRTSTHLLLSSSHAWLNRSNLVGFPPTVPEAVRWHRRVGGLYWHKDWIPPQSKARASLL